MTKVPNHLIRKRLISFWNRIILLKIWFDDLFSTLRIQYRVKIDINHSESVLIGSIKLDVFAQFIESCVNSRFKNLGRRHWRSCRMRWINATSTTDETQPHIDCSYKQNLILEAGQRWKCKWVGWDDAANYFTRSKHLEMIRNSVDNYHKLTIN